VATIADVLRHLVKHAPDLYDDGRREFLDATDATDAKDAPQPAAAEPAEPQPDPSGG
jgi:hypothetical protein